MKTVFYSFTTGHEWWIDHPECLKEIIDETEERYTPLSRESLAVRKGITFLKCPAHTDFLKNIFVLRAPIDLNIEILINKDGDSKIWCDNITQEIFSKIIDVRYLEDSEKGISPYPTVGIDFLSTFTCKESLMVQLLPPFLHYNEFTEKTTLIPGEFDISKWTRPVELVFEFKNKQDKIHIKQGDAIAYFKFNTTEIVKLEQANRAPWDEMILCNAIRESNKRRPLKERYESLAEERAKRCPYER